MNLGNLVRSAHAFGASFVFLVARRVQPARGELRHVAGRAAAAGLRLRRTSRRCGCRAAAGWWAVELVDDAVDLPSFRHPLNAAYVFGPERSSLSPAMLARCDHVVRIPTRFCINLAVAGAVVMYDRMLSPRPVRRRGRCAPADRCRWRGATGPVRGATRRDHGRRHCAAARGRQGASSPRPPYQRQRGRCDRSRSRMRPLACRAPGRLAQAAGPAAAHDPARSSSQPPRLDGLRGRRDRRGRVCYVASEPTKQTGDYKKRGNPAVLVARLPGEPPTEQVSVHPGYTYKKGSTVELEGRRQQVHAVHPRRARLGADRRRRQVADRGDEGRHRR